MKIDRILCPIDFSDTSAHAIDQAVAVARRYHARITALYVDSAMVASVPRLDIAGGGATMDEEPLGDLRVQVAAHCEAATRAGISVESLVETGRPAHHIVEAAERLRADMIVMGTHGVSGFEHLVLGSVTEKVLRRATCPVLTVPPRPQSNSRLPFQRVLCAIDFSPCSLVALQSAVSLARESAAGLTLLHVVEWPWHEPLSVSLSELPPAQAAALTEYRRYCEYSATARLASLLPDETVSSKPSRTRVCHGTPHVEIVRAAVDEQADLIVVGVHGRNPISLNLFGSTANQLVRSASCPVLTVRSPR